LASRYTATLFNYHTSYRVKSGHVSLSVLLTVSGLGRISYAGTGRFIQRRDAFVTSMHAH
ncbi:MAG: hypothetical protein E7E83_18255, partial [Enterobacter ludwigii]|nr:hypothetical protein [Enterobacter ludwigii]